MPASRSHSRSSFALLALLLLAPFASAQGSEPVGRPVVYKTVDGKPLTLYISSPEGDTSAVHPAIVFFHGGGWTAGAVTQFNPQTIALAARGMVVVNVEYRLIARAPSLEPPQICLEDAKSAMRWVRAHAKELHIDANRIAAGGGSAGGYLAAATALVPGWEDPADDLAISPKPNALVLFFPVLDVSPAGYGQKRFGDDYAKYAPGTYVSAKMPPTIIFAGLADKLVKPDTLRNFKAQAEKAGGHCELIFYPDQPHGFANKEPYTTITLTAGIHFLKSIGYLSASTTDPAPPANAPANAETP